MKKRKKVDIIFVNKFTNYSKFKHIYLNFASNRLPVIPS